MTPGRLDRSLIEDLPIFEGFKPEALDDILSGARAARYPKGTPVFSQDEKAQSFFVLLHGRLRVTQQTPQGAQIVVRFVTPGEIFGIAVALGRETFPATAEAVVDSVCLIWPNALWEPLTSRHPQLTAKTMQTVGNRLQDAHTRLREISTEDVERRVAHAVLRLAGRSSEKTEEGVAIDFPLSRQDIAEMTGTTLHTVSRIVSGWEAAGWVRGGRQRLVIRDRDKLAELADRPAE